METLANARIQELNQLTTCYKILNAMLNGCNGTEFEGFLKTKQAVIEDILSSNDLEELAGMYDDCFLMPMRASGGRPRSRTSSATDRVQSQENIDSDSSSYKSNGFKTKVRERDGNKCALTGTQSPSNGHQVAHFIPQSLLEDKKDSKERIIAKRDIRGFILRLCPWLPSNFFENLDVCENGLLLNYEAHRLFGAFYWFVTMETDIDGKITYKAMQVEENGLLNSIHTGRFTTEHYAGRDFEVRISSFNQPLFIGDTHPQPGFIYVKLHEMLARIFKMRGQAQYYEMDCDDEYDPVQCTEKLLKYRQDTSKTLNFENLQLL
jgi:hypothetical protein